MEEEEHILVRSGRLMSKAFLRNVALLAGEDGNKSEGRDSFSHIWLQYIGFFECLITQEIIIRSAARQNNAQTKGFF